VVLRYLLHRARIRPSPKLRPRGRSGDATVEREKA
jgi:hypothetical protein